MHSKIIDVEITAIDMDGKTHSFNGSRITDSARTRSSGIRVEYRKDGDRSRIAEFDSIDGGAISNLVEMFKVKNRKEATNG